MVKSYLRYEPRASLGVVVSGASTHPPAALLDRGGRLCFAAAGENVVVWEAKRGVQVALWRGDKHEVTALALSPDGATAAVGYADGSVQLWQHPSGISITTFNGHRNAVSALAFDRTGTRLASGSKDTDVIVWDVVGERGLFRLKGHKDAITAIVFLKHADQLLTSSKDTLVKLWDVPTTHCVETLVAHRSEVWSMDVNADETLLVTGSSDAELQLWRIDKDKLGQQLTATSLVDLAAAQQDADPQTSSSRAITLIGPVQRTVSTGDRTVCVRFIEQRLLACQAASKEVEIFQLYDDKAATKKAAKKGREAPLAADRMASLAILRSTSPKIISTDVVLVAKDQNKLTFRFLLAMQNNSIEIHKFVCVSSPKGFDAGQCETVMDVAIQREALKGDVRAVAIGDNLIAAGASNTVKLYNSETRACIRSFEGEGNVMCVLFTPGNRQIVVGTKTGAITLYDVSSGEEIFSLPQAHSKSVWSMQITPDGKGLVSGSADHDVKFWEFELVTETNEDGQAVRRVTIVHTRTLQMTDEVLALRCSPDGKLIAVALLDSTVKVFYLDTLKFFLSLYGHKLPVMSLDISSDSTLLISGSADKTVKIWGLDFGDCHRSLLAHADAVTGVQFVPNTHYFFSSGKDKLVKHWDGDKFELIQKLGEPVTHFGVVWSLAVSRLGDMVVSGGADRALRIAERSDEQVFLEEEREKEMETLFEEGAAERSTTTEEKSDDADTTSAGKATAATLKGAERIIDAMDLAAVEQAKLDEYELHPSHQAKPTPHPMLMATNALNPSHYVLLTVAAIPSAELEEAMLVLPFAFVLRLLALLDEWIQLGWKLELSCRVLFFLLATHQDQLIANRSHRAMLDSLRTKTRAAIEQQKNMVGFNLAALNYAKRHWEANNSVRFFDVGERLDTGLKVKKPRLVV